MPPVVDLGDIPRGEPAVVVENFGAEPPGGEVGVQAARAAQEKLVLFQFGFEERLWTADRSGLVLWRWKIQTRQADFDDAEGWRGKDAEDFGDFAGGGRSQRGSCCDGEPPGDTTARLAASKHLVVEGRRVDHGRAAALRSLQNITR